MATFIQTSSMLSATTPSDAGTIIRNNQFGIDSVLSGYIIQNVNTNHVRVYDETFDQKGALVSELDYDEQWTADMTIIGGNGDESGELDNLQVGDITISWNGHTWKLRSVQFQGTYNQKKQYSIQLFRAKNFPTQA